MLELPYAFEQMRVFPGMQPLDTKVWRTFIEQFPNYFDACDYNYRVGIGTNTDPDASDSHNMMIKMNSKLKIDVIGVKGDRFSIVEVKEYMLPAAVGQLLVYQDCFHRDTNYLIKANLICLCNYVHPDVARYCLENDILILTVPPAA
jgi:hypothetical protein